jgi:quinol monooxygenase YgiN
MVIVTVKSTAKPKYAEAYQKEFYETAKKVRSEVGCLEYELYQKDPHTNVFFLFERWESKKHVEIHLKTQHMLDFLDKTQDWFESKDVKIYEVL